MIDACAKHGVKQLVHISSMSVIDWAGNDRGGPVTEEAAVEPRPDERGAYTRAKLEAEKLVVAAVAAGLPAVILRPGQIFGGGIPLINGAVARNAGGRWLVLGDGKLELPLVYIDDVVDAITAAVKKKLSRGEIIQIIDPEHLTQEDVLGLAGGSKPILRVPRPVVFALGKLSEFPLGGAGAAEPDRGVPAQRRRCRACTTRASRRRRSSGWKPRVGVREGASGASRCSRRAVRGRRVRPAPGATLTCPPGRAHHSPPMLPYFNTSGPCIPERALHAARPSAGTDHVLALIEARLPLPRCARGAGRARPLPARCGWRITSAGSGRAGGALWLDLETAREEARGDARDGRPILKVLDDALAARPPQRPRALGCRGAPRCWRTPDTALLDLPEGTSPASRPQPFLLYPVDEVDGLVGPRRWSRSSPSSGTATSSAAGCPSRPASVLVGQRQVRTTCCATQERRAVAWLGTTSPFNISAEATTLAALHRGRVGGAPPAAHRGHRAALLGRGGRGGSGSSAAATRG